MGSFSGDGQAGARPSSIAARRLPHRTGLEPAPAPGKVLVGAHQTGGAGPGAIAGMRQTLDVDEGGQASRSPAARRPGARSPASRSAPARAPGREARRPSAHRARPRRPGTAARSRPAPAAGAASRAWRHAAAARPGMASRVRAGREGVPVRRDQRREAEIGRRRKAAAVDHAAREVVVLGKRQDGIAQRAAGRIVRRDELGRAGRVPDVLVGRDQPLLLVAVEQRFRGRAREHAGELPGEIVGVLDAAVEAARAERRDLVGSVAEKDHAAVAKPAPGAGTGRCRC